MSLPDTLPDTLSTGKPLDYSGRRAGGYDAPVSSIEPVDPVWRFKRLLSAVCSAARNIGVEPRSPVREVATFDVHVRQFIRRSRRYSTIDDH